MKTSIPSSRQIFLPAWGPGSRSVRGFKGRAAVLTGALLVLGLLAGIGQAQSQDPLVITPNGKVTVNGPLTVTGETTAAKVTVDGPLDVTGDTTAAKVTVDGSLDVTGDTTAAKVTVNGPLDVTGNIRGRGVAQQFSSYGESLVSESGTSTSWSQLPTDMVVVVDTDASTLWLDASISRVQHGTANVNTEFRISVDDKAGYCITNTGNTKGWAYRAVHWACQMRVAAGKHVIRVEYKTQKGRVNWIADANGSQVRTLNVIEFKN